MRAKYKSMGSNRRPCIYVNKYVLDTISLGRARLNEYDYNSIGGSMNLITTISTLAVGMWFYEYNYNYTVLWL